MSHTLNNARDAFDLTAHLGSIKITLGFSGAWEEGNIRKRLSHHVI